jgi:hypothetical protein
MSTSQVEVPKLMPKDLFQKRIKRDQARLKTYNQILEQIYSRVYSTSQMNGNANYIMYNVPPFILGLPAIDMEDCIVYIVYMLRQHGYQVRFTYPNLLYISWKHHEKDYLLTQNPIVQAMLPPEVKKAQKQKSKVSFQSQNMEYQTMTRTAEQPQIRKAIDYVPPPAFVQSIQRPVADKKDTILSDLWNFS